LLPPEYPYEITPLVGKVIELSLPVTYPGCPGVGSYVNVYVSPSARTTDEGRFTDPEYSPTPVPEIVHPNAVSRL
jgi:hypothetical protein